MKTRKYSVISIQSLILCALCVLCGSPSARAFEWLTNSASTFVQFTNSVNNATNTGTTGTAYVFEQGVGATLWLTTTAADVGTSNVIAGFNYVGKNGQHTTGQPLSLTNACNGTTTVTGCTQLTPAQVANIYSLSFERLATSQTNAVTTTIRIEQWR